MNLLTQNSKIKKTGQRYNVRLFNWTIPAYKTRSGKLTCPMAQDCIKFCYARKGAYIWSNVKPAFEKRYELSKTDQFVNKMYDEIVKKKPDYVRVHDSGDYYSRKYLNKWIDIALLFPEVKFYSYTNMVQLTKEADLPSNFDIIYSDSGKQTHLIDYQTDRYTKIFGSDEELDRAGYVNASKVDLFATKWFSNNKKVGLVYH